ncbi:MAG: ankyrin repeat domain-containing protein [Rickettsiales bacterium]
MIAFQNGQDQLCCSLIENQANPETIISKNNSILFLAYKQNKMNIFETLLKYGANPDVYFEEKIAIYKAYTDKKENAFALLLENGADPEITCEDGKTILLNSFFKYLKKGEDDYFKRIFKLLIDQTDYTDCKHNGYHLIFYTIRDEKYDMLELLLANGFNPNQISEDGLLTPLHLSVQFNDAKANEILLQYDANPNLKTLRGTNSIKSVNNCLDTFLLAQQRYRGQSSQNFSTCGQEALTPRQSPSQTTTTNHEYPEKLNMELFKSDNIVNPKINQNPYDAIFDEPSILHDLSSAKHEYSTHFNPPKSKPENPKCQVIVQKKHQHS